MKILQPEETRDSFFSFLNIQDFFNTFQRKFLCVLEFAFIAFLDGQGFAIFCS